MRLLRPSDAITTSAPNARAAATSSVDVVLERELDAERLAARLQDVEQALAADAAEAVAAARDRASLEMDVDVVPVVERVGDVARGFRVGGGEVAERLVGEHDAPAERVVRPVALDHPHHVPRDPPS